MATNLFWKKLILNNIYCLPPTLLTGSCKMDDADRFFVREKENENTLLLVKNMNVALRERYLNASPI